MSLPYPDSNRCADVDHLTGTIAYLSARLREAERAAESARYQRRAARRELFSLRKRLDPSFIGRTVPNPFIREDDLDQLLATPVEVEVGSDSELPSSTEDRRRGHIVLDDLELELGVNVDPCTAELTVRRAAGDEQTSAVVELLLDGVVALPVRLNRALKDGVLKFEPREAGHDSSPSEGGCGDPQPTEGGAPHGAAHTGDLS